MQGNGECQAVIDEQADGKHETLLLPSSTVRTDEGATHWWVYRAMSSTVHRPLFNASSSMRMSSAGKRAS